MFAKRSVSAYGSGIKRKQIIRKALLAAGLLFFLCLLPALYLKLRDHGGNARDGLSGLFGAGDFEAAYSQSAGLLNEKPLDHFLLTVHGFSAYELALAQINNPDKLSYIDSCIWSLRRSLLLNGRDKEGRVFYVLGKAYYYKGQGYADLAVKYLEKARAASFPAEDIPEYLGMAYAAAGDFRNSVGAFTLALTGAGPSDILLLSIARSYLALEEYGPARAYLVRCREVSRDSRNIAAARLLLAGIMVETGDAAGAEAEFRGILEEHGEYAEAHYRLGELYAAGGDTTRARAEWRRAVRVDPAYAPARSRLNL